MSNVDSYTPASADDLAHHYAGVRSRLGMGPARPKLYRPPPPPPPPPPPEPPAVVMPQPGPKHTEDLPVHAVVARKPKPSDVPVEDRIRLTVNLVLDWSRPPTRFNLHRLPLALAEAFDIRVEDLLSTRSYPHLVFARHIGFAIATQMTNSGTSKIGRLFRRDHTTVMYGRDKMKALVQDALAQDEITTSGDRAA